MKTGTTLVTTLFALACLPLLAQQSSPSGQPNSPVTQQNSQGMAPQNSPGASPEASAAQMSPVNGELVSKLDSKTAKIGDSVVVQTKAPVKTADGTEIPKGSKLVGRVIGAQPSTGGQNSQVALQFDHLELKGGQSLPIHSQIQSISPSANGSSATGDGAMSQSPANPGMSGANGSSRASSVPQATGGDPAATTAGNSGPAAGTIVARAGNIAIRTTSVPGVLLANNAPGEQDPRMAQVSSILLGAKQDIQLDGGTKMVLGISPGGGGTQ
jgi:hypothetical protein